MITLAQLKLILPNTKPSVLELHLPHLDNALAEFEINTKTRIEQFVAQMAHESCGFRYMAEIASGRAYEGRSDLGNTHAGDGVRFKGRSPVQITGRKNYTLCGDALSLDCVAHPEILENPQHGWRVAGWFWTVGAMLNLSKRAKLHLETKYGSRKINLNDLADVMDFEGITLCINGGMNGYDDRHKYLVRAIAALEPELKQA